MIVRGENLLDWAVNILKRESSGKLYGSVVFTFQDGLIVAVKTEKSEKPPKLNPSNTW